jgi:hypothetical protein
MSKFAFVIFATASTILNVADAEFGGFGRPRGQGGGRPGGQDGGRAGGRPGCGPRGPPGNFTIVDLNCTAVPDEPECPQGRNGEQLAWVCREGFDRETGEEKPFSTCVNPDLGHSTDSCGCCEDLCPQPCECICDLLEEGDGLGVSVIEQDGDETETDEHCMDPMRAFRKVTHSDRYTCNTTCVN